MQTLKIGRSFVVLIVGALALAACDDNDSDNGGGNGDGIASLGEDFVEAFNQERNDEPLEASDLDLELTPTIEPFDP